MPIFRLEPEGGKTSAWLYAGGWTRDAVPREGWAVIDLTGTKAPSQDKIVAQNTSGKSAFAGTLHEAGKSKAGPWLTLPIKDYDVPAWTRELWDALAVDVAKLLMDDVPVMVACVGGHGRTGLVVCILAGILRPDLAKSNPIKWLRENYCDEAVETRAQVDYVFEILELNDDGTTRGAKIATVSANNGGYNRSGNWSQTDYSKAKEGEYKPGRKWDYKTGKWLEQPSGSEVGPSRDGSEVYDERSSSAYPKDQEVPGGTGTDYTERQVEALERLSKMGAGFWEDDAGMVVDVVTGEKFSWDEVDMFIDMNNDEEIVQNHWKEWEEADGQIL